MPQQPTLLARTVRQLLLGASLSLTVLPPVMAADAKPLEQMHDYLSWLDQLLREGAANGSDMPEMIRSPIPERFAGISLSRYELIRSVSHLYPQYERGQMQRVDTP